jgi:DNA (cytosine-5)-methyltransferase 1
MDEKEPRKILEDFYQIASSDSFLFSLNEKQKEWLNSIIDNAESFKAVLTVLTTSLVKKIEDPNQDVRYHKVELEGGYSGRTYDTKYVTPFFKDRFARLAMKESGWLTRSIEQPRPFTLDFPGKIRSPRVKESFLQILNDIEENKANPELYLIHLFIYLIRATNTPSVKSYHNISPQKVTIDSIIEKLKLHFSSRYKVAGASKLPVIAIYSIYELLINGPDRYKGKKLKPLKSHLSSDIRAKSIGDIEIVDEDESYFEAIEIKHGKQIDSIMVSDAYEKFKDKEISRYYLLTTAEPNIKCDEREAIHIEIEKIKKEHGCEVIANGIIPSLRYYLRLLSNPEMFIERYTENLRLEFLKSTEIKTEHIEKWKELLCL